VFDFINKLFGKDTAASKDVAKQRLQLVLVHDRASISPQMLEALKTDLIQVITKYVDIDEQALEVAFENTPDNTVALVANIPVKRMKRGAAVGAE